MELLLMRHGLAVDRSGPGAPTDSERPLSEQGWARTREAARGLARVLDAPDAVLSSPLVRALQTAALVAEAFDIDDDALVTPTLEPHRHPRELLELVAGLGHASVLCVGHAPHLDRVVAHVLGSQRLYVTELKQSAVVRLRVGEGDAWLVGLLQPRVLRRLGRASD